MKSVKGVKRTKQNLFDAINTIYRIEYYFKWKRANGKLFVDPSASFADGELRSG
jgi:hypothetical protein